MEDDCIAQSRVAMLEDYDVTSCYDIINTEDTFVLDRRYAVIDKNDVGNLGITHVNITTYNMPCGERFHVEVYVKGLLLACGPTEKRVHCGIISQSEIIPKYTQCVYKCDCHTISCSDYNIIYMKVRHPLEGGLCDITMVPN